MSHKVINGPFAINYGSTGSGSTLQYPKQINRKFSLQMFKDDFYSSAFLSPFINAYNAYSMTYIFSYDFKQFVYCILWSFTIVWFQ